MMTLTMKFYALLAEIAKNRSANFAMLTSLLLVPLLGLVGLSFDVARALEVKTRLQHIADAAIMAALNPSSVAQKQRGAVAYSYTDPSWSKAALSDFGAQIKLMDPDINVTSNMNVRKTGNILQSELTFTASIPTALLKILNIDHINISGKALGTYNGAIFKDFYVLVDNSPSMGLGATTADINLLKSKIGCAFACHTIDGTDDNYSQALATGAKLRIDVVRSGIANIADAVKASRGTIDIYRVALFNFGVKAETFVSSKIEQLAALTSDMNVLTTAGQKLALMTQPTSGYNSFALTDLNSALTAINTRIATPGDGTSVSQAQKYVIFVTDGVQNRWKITQCNMTIYGNSRCVDYILDSSCTALKNRGIKLAVLYTTYIPLTSSNYITYVKPFMPKVPTSLQACASPGLYFEVTPDQGIPAAMEALFATLTAAPVITQ